MSIEQSETDTLETVNFVPSSQEEYNAWLPEGLNIAFIHYESHGGHDGEVGPCVYIVQ